MRSLIKRLNDGDDGHAAPLAGTLLAAAGSIVLAIGAAGDNDGAAIAGGILLAVGLFAQVILNHVTVEWELFRRSPEK